MNTTWQWYVYILECDDCSYYTGMTRQYDERWQQHLSGLGGRYTHDHMPVKLAYVEQRESSDEAKLREKQIKWWSRAKKENLISGRWGK